MCYEGPATLHSRHSYGKAEVCVVTNAIDANVHIVHREAESRTSEGLLIDFDNSAKLDREGAEQTPPEELLHRTVCLQST